MSAVGPTQTLRLASAFVRCVGCSGRDTVMHRSSAFDPMRTRVFVHRENMTPRGRGDFFPKVDYD